MDKKRTIRKNNVKQVISWPTENEFWTVKDLLARNPHFVPITLRVRLADAIKKYKTVDQIGDKMNAHGRPEMVLAMRRKDGTVNPAVIVAAKKAGIRCGEPTTVVVKNISPSQPSTGVNTSVNLNPTTETVSV